MAFVQEYETSLTYDLPIEYKELKIYPATIRDYFSFYSFIGCFFLEKNSVPDIEIIQMSYLDYMYKKSLEDQEPYILMFMGLMSLCLKIKATDIKLEYDKNEKPTFIINEIVYDREDFDEIKNIICKQNLVTLPDESVPKEIRDKIQEGKDLKAKLDGNGNKTAPIEDLIVAVSISTGLELESVYDLTIRKFNKMIQRIDGKLHYEIYLSASMSGLVEFKDKSFIKHWLTNLDRDEDADYKLNLEDVKAKVGFEDKKI